MGIELISQRRHALHLENCHLYNLGRIVAFAGRTQELSPEFEADTSPAVLASVLMFR
jgi:hypothetical protein